MNKKCNFKFSLDWFKFVYKTFKINYKKFKKEIMEYEQIQKVSCVLPVSNTPLKPENFDSIKKVREMALQNYNPNIEKEILNEAI